MSAQFATFTRDESNHVNTIVDRVLAFVPDAGRASDFDAMSIWMDLSAVHFHTPLRLAELAAAKDSDLIHDVLGIARHLDRETGKLRDCFLPRYAAPSGA